MIKKCKNCEKEFEAQKASQKFCSVLCYRLNVRKQLAEFYEQLKKGSA